jgi:hypothetical protein
VRPMPHHSPASGCVSRVGPREPKTGGDADAGPVDGTTQEPSKRGEGAGSRSSSVRPGLAGSQGCRRESAATRQWTMVALLDGVPVQGDQPTDVNALQAGGVAATARPPLAPRNTTASRRGCQTQPTGPPVPPLPSPIGRTLSSSAAAVSFESGLERRSADDGIQPSAPEGAPTAPRRFSYLSPLSESPTCRRCRRNMIASSSSTDVSSDPQRRRRPDPGW